MVTSSRVTPGNSAVTTTLFSPSQMFIGGKSRAVVALYPENSRLISVCIRRNSTKGSKPNRGNSESAMVGPPLTVDPRVAAKRSYAAWKQSAGAHDCADRDCRCAVRTAEQRLGSYPHKEAT